MLEKVVVVVVMVLVWGGLIGRNLHALQEYTTVRKAFI